MQLILLSGGSGKRLWPLSNDSYSKQFLRLLPIPGGGRESMLQRVVRQIRESGIGADITIATSERQQECIKNQLGDSVDIVMEPERRDTFPAIALACLYLAKEKGCSRNETVVVMPSDPYTDGSYFSAIQKITEVVDAHTADLVLMGIVPDHASTKYGYVVPRKNESGEPVQRVERFTEKPSEENARTLMDENAFWNGGVFAFRLGYLLDIIQTCFYLDTFVEARARYSELPKISFDYEVVEKARSVAVVPFYGLWKDLGTWDALVEVLGSDTIGNVCLDDHTVNTRIVNMLNIPCICVGTNNLIVASSPDGILVADKGSCELIKPYVSQLDSMPMYEELRWGTCKVVDHHLANDGKSQLLTKRICINAGQSIYGRGHGHYDEIWTFVEGTGEFVHDGKLLFVKPGEVIRITKGTKYEIKAIIDIHAVSVQISSITVADI